MPVDSITMIGFGAIGQEILSRCQQRQMIRISDIVVPGEFIAAAREVLGETDIQVSDQVPRRTTLLLECAGHSAIHQHVLQALRDGIETAVLSIGALSEPGLPEALKDAAWAGKSRVHLLSGAIGGIDAIAAARIDGLSEVVYTGRKPPLSWQGTPAALLTDLEAVSTPICIFEGNAREAARLYPQNANVAATVSLAGLGFEATKVKLFADPTVTRNTHEVVAKGPFGEMKITLENFALASNPKTSALTVYSALRFLENRISSITI